MAFDKIVACRAADDAAPIVGNVGCFSVEDSVLIRAIGDVLRPTAADAEVPAAKLRRIAGAVARCGSNLHRHVRSTDVCRPETNHGRRYKQELLHVIPLCLIYM